MTVFDELMYNRKSTPELQVEPSDEGEREQFKAAPPHNGIEQKVHKEDIWGISERASRRTSELANKEMFSSLDTDRNNELSKQEIASGMSRWSGSSMRDLDRRAGLKMLHDSFDQVKGIGRAVSVYRPDTISKDDLNTFVRIANMRIDADNHRIDPKAGDALFRSQSKAILGENAMPRSELTSHTLRVVAIGLGINYLMGGWKQALFSAPVYGAFGAGTSYVAGRLAVNSRMNRLDTALNDWTNRISKIDSSDFPKGINMFDVPKQKQ